MKIENQVCTIEQGKRLKELGIIQFESIFSYVHYFPDPTGQSDGWSGIISKDNEISAHSEHLIDLFTVAELGVILPDAISSIRPAKQLFKSQQHYPHGKWHIAHTALRLLKVEINFKFLCGKSYDTQAECLADFLIHLLATKQITVEECNQRLSE